MLRVIEEHLESEHVSRVTYGAIIGMALVVTLEHHPTRPGVMAGTLVATALAVALAELFSEVVGVHARTHHVVELHHLRHAAGDVLAVGFGVVFPVVFFVAAAFGAIDVDTAFQLAKWSGLGLIAFYGFCAARLSGAGWVSALLQASAVALIGGLLILFKALVH